MQALERPHPFFCESDAQVYNYVNCGIDACGPWLNAFAFYA